VLVADARATIGGLVTGTLTTHETAEPPSEEMFWLPDAGRGVRGKKGDRTK